MSKINELAKFLDIETEDLDESSYDESLFSLGNQDYLVYTDGEADEAVKDYIEQSVWAFRAGFICHVVGLPYEAEEMIETFCGAKCEGANDTILALIDNADGLDHFVEQAVSADGRGHFLNHYDGDEIETANYYVYRTN